MASSIQFLLFCSFFLVSLSYAKNNSHLRALVLPVRKDATTLQYLTTINQRTPLVPVNLVVDLGGQFLWVDCEENYVSSTYHTIRCGSPECTLAKSNACGGSPPTTCVVSPENTITRTSTVGELSEDLLSIPSTNGSFAGTNVTVRKFLFSCAPNSLLKGLAKNATGMAGLGHTRVSLASQFRSSFRIKRKFAICLCSSTSGNGALFFGQGPYNFLPNIDPSYYLTYTPLLKKPANSASSEYFIGVTAIKIKETIVTEITSGATKISTIQPYTVLESSIYKPFVEYFISEAEAMNITRVEAVAPFDFCFSKKGIAGTQVGPFVPLIDFVLQRDTIVWTITGANSMVDVGNDVLCLGFVDGGYNATHPIVIGGHQLENKFLQFDLSHSQLGFSPTLYAWKTTCENFDFASSP